MGLDLVPYIGPQSQIEYTIEELERLKAQKSIAQKQQMLEIYESDIENLSNSIQKMHAELSGNAPELVAQIVDLELFLSTLDAKVAQNAEEEGIEDEPEEDVATNRAARREEARGKNTRSKSRTLFQRIAALCHPDKTKRQDLHELFKRARKAYVADDVEELELILLEAKTPRASLLSELLAKMFMLDTKIAQAKSGLNEIRSGQQFRMLSDWNIGCKDPVQTFFNAGLERRVQSLRARIELKLSQRGGGQC